MDPERAAHVSPAMSASPTHRVFLLSPASLGGVRGRALLEGRSSAPFLPHLEGRGVPLHDVFQFISSLYFRGKRAYAEAFARPPEGVAGAQVITSSRGLLPAGTPVTLDDLGAMAAQPIGAEDGRYVRLLKASARALKESTGKGCDVVLLGSLATAKYVEPLQEVFGARLRAPSAFVGRGDMSRGGLLLRCVEAGTELTYASVEGMARRGRRPERLG